MLSEWVSKGFSPHLTPDMGILLGMGYGNGVFDIAFGIRRSIVSLPISKLIALS